jgi:two-component system phosphate regulon sensor histidine kinase PhoR
LDSWRRPIAILIPLSIAGLLVGAAVGPVTGLAVVCCILALIVLIHLRDLAALQTWLKDPRPETMPNVSGAWDPAFSQLARMVRSQRRSSAELKVTLDQFRLAAAAIPDGVCMLDDGNRLEWCNPSAKLHLGLDATLDTGMHVANLVRQPEFVEFLSREADGKPLRLKVARGDDDLVLSLQLVPYGSEKKLLMSQDITPIERVDTLRRDFVANVSHELRTPITVVAGFIETIADLQKPSPELIERAIHLMRDQTLRMQRLVEDLLTLSRLESEQNPVREANVDVHQLARDLYVDARALSKGKHHLQLSLESDAWLSGSEDELRSAFGNLISNAVRYTPEGGTITIGWGARGEEGVFWVKDTGIGIEPIHVPRLTERFYRVDRSRSRATGGTGLGLAIVKHVVNRHQGRLEVVSELDEGSTFSVFFPHVRLIAPPAERVASVREGATEPGREPLAQGRVEVR